MGVPLALLATLTRSTIDGGSTAPLTASDEATAWLWLRGPEGSVRVLVIDDDDAVRRAIRRMLRDHDVTACASASEALAILSVEGSMFDAILCDVRMPEMDGPAFYERLETLRPDLIQRVAFITGHPGGVAARHSLAATGRIVLEKPFTTELLVDVLRVLGR